MRNTVGFLLTFFIFASVFADSTQQSVWLTRDEFLSTATTWNNDKKSKMTLMLDNCKGKAVGFCTVSGVYINKDEKSSCRDKPYDLIGVYHIESGTISWSVAWYRSNKDDCRSVSSWTGYLDWSVSPLQIQTTVNLAMPGLIKTDDSIFTLEKVVSPSNSLEPSQRR